MSKFEWHCWIHHKINHRWFINVWTKPERSSNIIHWHHIQLPIYELYSLLSFSGMALVTLVESDWFYNNILKSKTNSYLCRQLMQQANISPQNQVELLCMVMATFQWDRYGFVVLPYMLIFPHEQLHPRHKNENWISQYLFGLCIFYQWPGLHDAGKLFAARSTYHFYCRCLSYRWM